MADESSRNGRRNWSTAFYPFLGMELQDQDRSGLLVTDRVTERCSKGSLGAGAQLRDLMTGSFPNLTSGAASLIPSTMQEWQLTGAGQLLANVRFGRLAAMTGIGR
jgi:hypothetical protein